MKLIKYLEIMKRHENLLQCNDKDIINKVKFELGMCDKKYQTKVKHEKYQQLHCDICNEVFTTIVQVIKKNLENK